MQLNNRFQIDSFCKETEIEVLFCDGYDDAIVGLGRCFNDYKVVYDKEKIIQILMNDKMSREEAEEFFEFNIVGAYVGESTPVFIESIEQL